MELLKPEVLKSEIRSFEIKVHQCLQIEHRFNKGYLYETNRDMNTTKRLSRLNRHLFEEKNINISIFLSQSAFIWKNDIGRVGGQAEPR